MSRKGLYPTFLRKGVLRGWVRLTRGYEVLAYRWTYIITHLNEDLNYHLNHFYLVIMLAKKVKGKKFYFLMKYSCLFKTKTYIIIIHLQK